MTNVSYSAKSLYIFFSGEENQLRKRAIVIVIVIVETAVTSVGKSRDVSGGARFTSFMKSNNTTQYLFRI